MTKFKATVRISDEDGSFVGDYLREGGGAATFYTDEHTWNHGGRPLFESEVKAWGYRVQQLEVKETHRTNAAFLVNGGWTWHTWNHSEPNKHAAIIAKAGVLGAKGYDCGNAHHEELSRYNRMTRP